MEPDHAFTLEELWPTIKVAGEKYGYDPKLIAGMARQESTFHNYRVHRDGHGHGLFGLDDRGLLPEFERWSGRNIGRGEDAAIIPPELQIEFAAWQLKKYADYYPGESDGAYVALRAWRAGGTGRVEQKAFDYVQLILSHVRALFGG